MLIYIAQFLESYVFKGFHVFQYTTFRALMASLTALFFCLWLGPSTIRKLTALKAGQPIRSDGPATHFAKTGTPTMGGVLILISITVSTLLWCDWRNLYIWICSLLPYQQAHWAFMMTGEKLFSKIQTAHPQNSKWFGKAPSLYWRVWSFFT